MAKIKLNCHLITIAICLLWSTTVYGRRGWGSRDIEIFDLVERVNQNFYTMLNVEETASVTEIKRAYRKLSIQYHPDRNKDENATQMFQDLSLVMEVLTDRNKRQAYDKILVEGLPDWKEPVYYLRKAKKMSFIEFIIVIVIISTISHWIYLWSEYLGKEFNRYMAQPTSKNLEKKAKKASKQSYYMLEPEVFQSPKLIDSLPCRIYFGSKWLYQSWPEHREYIVKLFHSWTKKEEPEHDDDDVQHTDHKRRKKPRIESRSKAPSTTARAAKKLVGPAADTTSKSLKSYESNTTNPKPSSMENNSMANKEWTNDEIVTLSRLMKRFPGGTRSRWEKIGQEMNRPGRQVAAMAETMKSNIGKIKPPNVTEKFVSDSSPTPEEENKENINITSNGEIGYPQQESVKWSPLQIEQLEEAIKEYDEDTEDRWDIICQFVPEKSKEECISKYLEMGGSIESPDVDKKSSDGDDSQHS